MPLDSDVSNADAQLHVEFYEYNGEGPHKGKPFVRIVVPGDKTNVIDQPARDDHKRRFQRQWLFYLSKSSEGQIVGTRITLWHQERPEELTEGQLSELVILKFQSVEQVAQASDGQIMRIGMGGIGMRDRARAYLSSKNAQVSGAEMERMKSELETLKAAMASAGGLAPDGAKPKRAGWPKGKKRTTKNKVKVNVEQHDAATGATGL